MARPRTFNVTGTTTGRLSSRQANFVVADEIDRIPEGQTAVDYTPPPSNPVRRVQSRGRRQQPAPLATPVTPASEVAVPIEDWRPEVAEPENPVAAAVAAAQQREHAAISPSGLKNVAICPAYRPENREGQDTTAADEGTAMHRAAETGLIPAEFDEEMRGCVQMCLDYVDQFINTPGVEIHRELRMEMGHTLTDLFGTADLVVYNHETNQVDVIDFKFGRIPVDDAEVNLQGKAYVLGAFTRFPEATAAVMHFLQPRIDEVSTHRFERSQANAMALEISAILARANAPTPEEHINTDNCLYCGRKAECIALRRLAGHITDRYEQDFVALPNLHSSQVTDPEQLAVMYRMARIVEKWADSVKAHSLQTYLGGTPIPGFQLKERAAARKIEEGDNVLATFNALTGQGVTTEFPMTVEQFIRACSVSPSKLETVAGDMAEGLGMTKAAAKRKISEVLAALGVVSQGQPTYYMQAER